MDKLDYYVKHFFPFSRANTTVMATGPVNRLGSFMVILSAHANEATAENNAREHGGPVI